MIRKPLSKKIRFDVFKRDSFCCQYCGNTPPVVVLEIDHIIPVCKNGTNNIDNLLTSCFDCNRGKSGVELTVLPLKTSEKVSLLKEKEDQYKEFQKIQKKIRDRVNLEVTGIDDLFNDYFPELCLNDNFKTSVKGFLDKLGYDEVYKSMEYSCSKMRNSRTAVKYFCGVCWGKIREAKNG